MDQPQSLIGALAQTPAILMALAALITAAAAAWATLTTKGVVQKTHDLVNSRFDEWKRETTAAAVAAAVAAHSAGVTAGRAELRAEQAKIAEGVVTGRAEVKAERAEKPKGEPS